MKSHINSVHYGKKDHKCDSCGKTFSIAVNLKKHIDTVDNGQKDHKCDSCEKAFSQSGGLKRHINVVHKGQKDHKCDSCGKSFSSAQNVKKHIHKIHKNGEIIWILMMPLNLEEAHTNNSQNPKKLEVFLMKTYFMLDYHSKFLIK